MDDMFFQQLVIKNELFPASRLPELRKKSTEANLPLVEAAIQSNLVSPEKIYKALAQEIGLNYISSINRSKVPQNLLRLIPISFARGHHIIPIEETDECVKIAISDPLDVTGVSDVETMIKKRVELVVTPTEEINSAINELYESAGAEDELGEKEEEKEEELTDILDLEDEAPIIRWVNNLFTRATRQRASDIHIEPTEKEVVVRYRIDGVLYNIKTAPKTYLPSIISRIKIMAGLNIAEKRLPQDGRIGLKIAGKNIDVRVSTIPTSQGERVVMRLLDKANVLLDLRDLGFSPATFNLMNELITRPHGIILVTGPTGCGKTTTLYAALSKINRPELNILTVEEPVEYDIKGINQMQVNPKIDLTFATGLRAFLRQDPDVIMVGEIRDRETAEIAIHASLTGHLVMSTIHTNDAAGALTRLVEMGIEPFLVASSMLTILAQRLVRVVCPHCKQRYIPTAHQLEQIGITEGKIKRMWSAEVNNKYTRGITGPLPEWWGGDILVYKATGCEECSYTGYRGRTGIYELLLITDKIRSLILRKEDSNTIKKAAIEEGMITLRDDGARKALLGITTLEEVIRVTQEEIS